MSETTDLTFEIRATQLPSPPRTYQFSIWLEDVQVTEGYAFEWDFGDGGISQLPSPIHTYTTTGDFDVDADVKPIDDRPDDEGDNSNDTDPPKKPPKLRLNVT